MLSKQQLNLIMLTLVISILLERFESRNRNLFGRHVGWLSCSQGCHYALGDLDDIAAAAHVASCDKLHGGQISVHAYAQPSARQHRLCMLA